MEDRIMKTKKGQRYRVVSDFLNFFKKGEIVVALENDDVPYCVRESDYIEGKAIEDYGYPECRALAYHELEPIQE